MGGKGLTWLPMAESQKMDEELQERFESLARLTVCDQVISAFDDGEIQRDEATKLLKLIGLIPDDEIEQIVPEKPSASKECLRCKTPMTRSHRKAPEGKVVHCSRGLCQGCYSHIRREKTLDEWPRTVAPRTPKPPTVSKENLRHREYRRRKRATDPEWVARERKRKREWKRNKYMTEPDWAEKERKRKSERQRFKKVNDPVWLEKERKRKREWKRNKRASDPVWAEKERVRVRELKRKARERKGTQNIAQ